MSRDTPGADRAPDAEPLPPERIARSAGLAGIATLTSRILGLVREQVLAAMFGASNEMDAFLVALRLPSLVRDLFAEGAMSAAFVPTFTRHLAQRGKADAWRLANNVITALILVTGAFVVLGILLARPIVNIYAPEFANVPGKIELTIYLGRLVLPFLTMAAVAAACMGMLNSLRHYFVPALAPSMFNVATLLCLLLLTPLVTWLGQPPIAILAIGTLVGGVGQIAVQWPALRREGFRFTPRLDLRDPGLRQILLLMGPGTLGIAATQINLFITTQLATYEGVGTVSWLQYAFRLIYLPIGLFGVSIATAVLPTVARHAASHDHAAIARTVGRGIGLMLVVNIPATIGLLILADDIVQLLFERGRFLPSDTLATATALRCYAIGLVGYATARISSPVFYALGRSRISVMVSVATIGLNVGLSLVLVRLLGFSGLALTTAICALFNGGVLLILLRRHLGQFDFGALATTLGKALAASAVMAAAVYGTLEGLRQALPGHGLPSEATRVLLAIVAGLIVLALSGPVLGIREINDAIRSARRRLGSMRSPTPP